MYILHRWWKHIFRHTNQKLELFILRNILLVVTLTLMFFVLWSGEVRISRIRNGHAPVGMESLTLFCCRYLPEGLRVLDFMIYDKFFFSFICKELCGLFLKIGISFRVEIVVNYLVVLVNNFTFVEQMVFKFPCILILILWRC